MNRLIKSIVGSAVLGVVITLIFKSGHVAKFSENEIVTNTAVDVKKMDGRGQAPDAQGDGNGRGPAKGMPGGAQEASSMTPPRNIASVDSGNGPIEPKADGGATDSKTQGMGTRTVIGGAFVNVAYTLAEFKRAHPDRPLSDVLESYYESHPAEKITELQGDNGEPSVPFSSLEGTCPVTAEFKSSVLLKIDQYGNVVSFHSNNPSVYEPPQEILKCHFRPVSINGSFVDFVTNIPAASIYNIPQRSK